jgi:hypothetical protein
VDGEAAEVKSHDEALSNMNSFALGRAFSSILNGPTDRMDAS